MKKVKMLTVCLIVCMSHQIKAQVRLTDTIDCRQVIKFQTESGVFNHRYVQQIIKVYYATENGYITQVQYYIDKLKVDIISFRNTYFLSTAKFDY